VGNGKKEVEGVREAAPYMPPTHEHASMPSGCPTSRNALTVHAAPTLPQSAMRSADLRLKSCWRTRKGRFDRPPARGRTAEGTPSNSVSKARPRRFLRPQLFRLVLQQ